MLRKMTFILIVVAGAILALVTIRPMATPIAGATITLPVAATPSATLPPCEYEDGSGQALCMWDASESGNGMGTDAIGGDCSIATVGSNEASALCVRVYADDASHVSECLDIAYEAEIDKAKRIELKNEGWTITECFKAML
jgi:hypothetical protein